MRLAFYGASKTWEAKKISTPSRSSVLEEISSTICFNQKGRFDYMLSRLFLCKFGTTLHMIKRYLQTAPFVI